MNYVDLLYVALAVIVLIWVAAFGALLDLLAEGPKPDAVYTGPVPPRWLVESYAMCHHGHHVRWCFNYSDGDHESVTVKGVEGRRLILSCDGRVQGWYA